MIFINRLMNFPNQRSVYMKRLYMYITGLLTLMGCISDYEPDIVNQIGGLLVVDGFITNDTTRIRLSHSVRMLDEFEEGESITDANVFVESDKGAVFETLNVSKMEFIQYRWES